MIDGIRDFRCGGCSDDWSEENTAVGPKPPLCPTCDPRAFRHRTIRENTRKRLREVKTDSVLADASAVVCPSRDKIGAAVRACLKAQGRIATAAAARELAVQSLAWSLTLSVGLDGVSDHTPA